MRVPSLRVDTTPARAMARRWCDVLATDCPISSATSSTERSPWASRSTISSGSDGSTPTSTMPTRTSPTTSSASTSGTTRETSPDAVVDAIPLVDEGLGNASWLVDLGDGRALVVDPARHPGAYLAAADARGVEVVFSAETHPYAEFVSGARELGRLVVRTLAP